MRLFPNGESKARKIFNSIFNYSLNLFKINFVSLNFMVERIVKGLTCVEFIYVKEKKFTQGNKYSFQQTEKKQPTGCVAVLKRLFCNIELYTKKYAIFWQGNNLNYSALIWTKLQQMERISQKNLVCQFLTLGE